MSNREENRALDRKVYGIVRGGAKQFYIILSRAETNDDRAVDRALQRLRKRGLLSHLLSREPGGPGWVATAPWPTESLQALSAPGGEGE